MNKSILEIGTEEIPAKLVDEIYSNFEQKTKELLDEYRISFDDIDVFGSPRRIAVKITGLSELQNKTVNEIKGPPKNIAFDDNNEPTKAATGFAKGQGIEVSDLIERETDRGIYLYAVIEKDRENTKEVLSTVYKRLIKEVNLPITMRWSNHNLKFIRPIHWILALFNDEKIEFSLEHLKASNITYGHRFLANRKFVIKTVDDYKRVLKKADVVVDPEQRKEIILQEINTIILEKNLKFKKDENLLKEVIHLVENPSPFIASFDEKYLKLPEPVIVTPLKEHQKYFPLWNKDGSLSNKFVVVKEGGKEYINNVREGNEKVLRARLEDADFYYKRDLNSSLDSFFEDLKGLVLREELGSMYDKSKRNMELSKKIAKQLDFSEEEIEMAEKASKYSKVDLVSLMVREFPELQGVMGSIYAKKEGYNQKICDAIKEHYLPDSADSKLPSSKLSKVVSLSDKIDTLTGFFGINLIPTGSQDPYGLRRAAIGIYRLIEDLNFELEVEKLFQLSLEVYRDANQDLKIDDKVISNIREFMLDRIQYIFKDKGYDVDIIRTVVYGLPLSIPLIKKALKLLDDVKDNESFNEFLTAYNRVDSIIKDVKAADVDENLFEKEEEKILYNQYKKIYNEVNSHIDNNNLENAYDSLIKIIEPVHDFFEEVRVMAEDPKIKNNRLSLLKNIQVLMKSLGDFSFKQ
ncbi:MAG: glycine--tRNA ligase subunit beta [Halanaerobiales bacterium]|nr:glycine--tRNA ligase subunit beta [Halanaerobiales bacterium]